MFLIRNHPFIRDLLDTLEKQARLAPLPATMVSAPQQAAYLGPNNFIESRVSEDTQCACVSAELAA